MTRRIRALLRKELIEISRHKSSLLPIAFVGVYCLVLAIGLTVLLPTFTGEKLSEDPDYLKLSASIVGYPGLSADGRIQAYFFQQFLLVFLFVPISVAMTTAAHAVVGEKEARTMEPLLATPLTTSELLIAKVIGALLPAVVVTVPELLLYLGAIAVFSEPGVLATMITWRSAAAVGVLAPGLSLIALQLTVLFSTRVQNEDTARQLAIVGVLPFGALILAQFTGHLWLSAAALAASGIGLIGAWLLLLALSVAAFDRDRVLTRWR